MNAVRPRLAEWARLWAAALPGFAVDSMWRVGHERWRPLYQRPFEASLETPGDLTFQILGLRSPDGGRTLFVDSYQLIQADGDSVEFGGDPDSQASLIDDRARVEAILHQCGTPCGFHWGAWISPAMFALGGWRDADDYSQWKQGCLWIYSIPDSTVTEYQTRIVSTEDYLRYQAAWAGWLAQRYRAWRRSPPRS